jgi:hypothetical protein
MKGEKRGGEDKARRLKIGQLTLSVGSAREEVRFLIQRVIIQVRGLFFTIGNNHTCI